MTAASWELVEGFGDDGVLEESFEGNDLEGVFMSGFQNHRAGSTGLLRL